MSPVPTDKLINLLSSSTCRIQSIMLDTQMSFFVNLFVAAVLLLPIDDTDILLPDKAIVLSPDNQHGVFVWKRCPGDIMPGQRQLSLQLFVIVYDPAPGALTSIRESIFEKFREWETDSAKLSLKPSRPGFAAYSKQIHAIESPRRRNVSTTHTALLVHNTALCKQNGMQMPQAGSSRRATGEVGMGGPEKNRSKS